MTSIMFFDCQGMKSCRIPGHSDGAVDILFELAWSVVSDPKKFDCHGTVQPLQEYQSLIHPGVLLPRQILSKIKKLCGISGTSLAVAPAELTVAHHFAEAIETFAPEQLVIHFASFEKPFLLRLWDLARPDQSFPVEIVCSRNVARARIPHLASFSLKAVAGFFDAPVEDLKRSAAHVAATKVIWERLASFQGGENSMVRPGGHLRNARLGLPDCPGVYQFIDAYGRILYVGKATSLRQRVNSYFTGGVRRDARKREMMAQVKGLKVTEAATPLHAALDEFAAITRHMPPYNILLKPHGQDVFWVCRETLELSSGPAKGRVGPFLSDSGFEMLCLLSRWVERGDCGQLLFPNIDGIDAKEFSDELNGAVECVKNLARSIGFCPDPLIRPRTWLRMALALHFSRLDEPDLLVDPRGEERQSIPWNHLTLQLSIRRKLRRAAMRYVEARAVRLIVGGKVLFDGGVPPIELPQRIALREEVQLCKLVISGIRAKFKKHQAVSIRFPSGCCLQISRKSLPRAANGQDLGVLSRFFNHLVMYDK